MNRRRLTIAAGGVALLLLLVVLVAPAVLRGPISTRVQRLIDDRIAARVSWSDVTLSVVRNFPNVRFGLDDIVVVGTGRFAADTLFAADRFALVLDAGSVWRGVRGNGPVVIRSIDVQRPAARLIVLEDGATNWDVIRPATDTTSAAGRSLALSLRRLAIEDASLDFDNRASGLRALIAGLDHSLSGDFAREQFTLHTATSADSLSLDFAGLPYLRDVAFAVDAALDARPQAGRFTLDSATIQLNALKLTAAGSVATHADSTVLDLAFAAPGTSFAELLSLLPVVYREDFASLRTAGTMTVQGHVRGGYGPDAFPSFALDARVRDGMFQYPDLPLPARDINFDLAFANPGGDADSTAIDLRGFRADLGGQPITGMLAVRTPISDPDVALRFDGTIDLADLPRTVKLPDVDTLQGTVVANVSARARRSALATRAWDEVAADGTIDVADLQLEAQGLRRPLHVQRARVALSPSRATLDEFRATLGSSDVTASGRLDNLLGFALFDEELTGSARVHSRVFDLNEWRSDDSELEAIPVPAGIAFDLDASADRVRFGTLDIANARGALRIADQRITLDDFGMDMLGGRVAATGHYETTSPERPAFDFALDLETIDIPDAFASLATVQAFAPVARYAQGSMSADVRMRGIVGPDMTPVFDVLSGDGDFQTTQLLVQDFPAFGRLADALHVEQLRNPGFQALASSFAIRDGRLHVEPFDVAAGGMSMNVAGSNGFDRSLDYTLALELPRRLLGAAANDALTSLASRTSQFGFDIASAETVSVAARLAGTVTDPSIALDLTGAAGTIRQGVEQALRDEVDERRDAVEARVDSAADAARERARQQTAERLRQAEARAEEIRAEARMLAERVRTEGYARADSLTARAANPAARIAAQAAATRVRREADEAADRIIEEADTRAEALIAEVRERQNAAADST